MAERREVTKGAATTAKRRAFLELAGVSTVGGVAAAALSATGAAAATVTPTAPSAGYRVTAHVRKAYQLARF